MCVEVRAHGCMCAWRYVHMEVCVRGGMCTWKYVCMEVRAHGSICAWRYVLAVHGGRSEYGYGSLICNFSNLPPAQS